MLNGKIMIYRLLAAATSTKNKLNELSKKVKAISTKELNEI